MSFTKKFFSTLFLIPAFGLNSYLALHFYCRDCYAWLSQANNIAHWLLLLGIIFLIVGVIFKLSLPTLLLFAPSALVFFIWFTPNLLPKLSNPTEAEGFTFTAATYNTGDNEGDAQQKFALIRDMDADIIALFEYESDLRGLVESELITEYPYQYQYPDSYRGEYKGFGFLSRFPIVSASDQVPYPLNPTNYQTRRYMRLVLDMNGQFVSVYLFHPIRPPFKLITQYDDTQLRENFVWLLAELNDEINPTILLCDCNFTPRSRQYAELNDVLFDSFAEEGWGFGLSSSGLVGLGYNFDVPLIRVDYIWHDIAIQAIDIKPWDDFGTSDHLPVWGRFRLNSFINN